MDQKRYFIGIQLPAKLADTIGVLQQRLYDERTTLAPLVPHITLLHTNVLTTLAPMHLMPRVRETSASYLPFTVRMTHIDHFGSHVLFIAVESTELVQLHNDLVAILPEKIRRQYYVGRSFTPHVTLMQAKPRLQIPRVITEEFIESLQGLLPHSFSVEHLYKFEWQSPRKYNIATIT
jgi:2'-5' RNA ligase